MLYVLTILLIVAIILWVMIPVRSKYLIKQRQERIEKLSRLIPDVDAAFAEISSRFSYSHYITESERKDLVEKYDVLFKY